MPFSNLTVPSHTHIQRALDARSSVRVWGRVGGVCNAMSVVLLLICRRGRCEEATTTRGVGQTNPTHNLSKRRTPWLRWGLWHGILVCGIVSFCMCARGKCCPLSLYPKKCAEEWFLPVSSTDRFFSRQHREMNVQESPGLDLPMSRLDVRTRNTLQAMTTTKIRRGGREMQRKEIYQFFFFSFTQGRIVT